MGKVGMGNRKIQTRVTGKWSLFTLLKVCTGFGFRIVGKEEKKR